MEQKRLWQKPRASPVQISTGVPLGSFKALLLHFQVCEAHGPTLTLRPRVRERPPVPP